MLRVRLLFEKTGRAQYISHLDLMRTFQRVFHRAGVSLRHTEGFNPHPYISFALPLSVGIQSFCELVDVDLSEETALDALPERLNANMPEGISVISAYRPETKFTGIARVSVDGKLVYDAGIPDDAVSQMEALFGQKELTITKKTKKGPADFNLAGHIAGIRFEVKSGWELAVFGIVSAQNPSINPELLMSAIRTHRPELTPDFASFRRLNVLDDGNKVFR